MIGCQKQVDISSKSNLNDNKRLIMEYEQNAVDYRIKIEFGYDSSLDNKMSLIEMVQQLDVNHRVGKLILYFNDSSKFNGEMVRVIMEKYHNIYHIEINDWSNSLDKKVYESIKELLAKSTLTVFELWFSGVS